MTLLKQCLAAGIVIGFYALLRIEWNGTVAAFVSSFLVYYLGGAIFSALLLVTWTAVGEASNDRASYTQNPTSQEEKAS